MRGRSPKSREERLAWRRLGDAYEAMERAEVELAAALQGVVMPAGANEAEVHRRVVPLRRRGIVDGSEVRA